MPAIKLKKVTAEYLAEKEREAEKSKRNLEDLADEEEEKQEKENDDEEEPKPYNFLDVKVLWDKRKRTIPAVEQTLIDWLDSNLERRTDVYLPLQTLYNYYSDVCQMRGASVVDVPIFNRYIREKFGKFYGFQENSPYRVLIKEKKIREKTKVQGETLQLKIRDIITEVLNDAGNPRKGLRFPVISKAIISKYPAQRVDLYPKKLKAALERGVGYGYMELVRGVGMCGYYRMPGEPTIEEEDKKESEEEKEEGGEKTENGTADTDEGKSEGEESQPDKGTKRSADGDMEADSTKDQPPKKKAKKNANKKKKKKPVERVYRSEASRHSDPQRVEEAFPLAFTYQSDPKEASGLKIMRYISKHYHKDVNTEKLKKVLESGIEKGLWEQTKGNGVHGTYHLLSESFNPGRSEQLSDQVAQALVACHEPKTASAGLIKKYITNYHSKLNIEARPHLFKNALERACQKGTLRQLSGIGAHGTFQLMDVFNPSPAILAGDESDDEEEVEEEEDDVPVEYVPRPTKRGRLPAKPKTQPAAVSKPKSKKKADAKAVSKGKKSRGKVVEESDEEEQEPTEYKPTPSKSRGGSSEGGRGRKQAPPSKKPAKAKATPKTKAKSTPTPAKKASNKKSKKGSGKKARSSSKKKAEEDLDVSDQEMMPEEYTPRSTKSRGGASKGNAETPATSPAKSSKRKLLLEDDADDLEVDTYVPKPSKSRGSKGVAETPTKQTTKRKRR